MKKLQKRRTMSTFLYITLVLVLALGATIFFSNRVSASSMNSLSNEIKKTAAVHAKSFLTGLESDMERIWFLQSECQNDSNFNRLLLCSKIMGNHDYVSRLNQLINKLSTIRYSSRYVKDVAIHSKVLDRSISCTTLVDELNTELFENLRVSDAENRIPLVVYQDRMYLSTLRKEQVYRPMQENVIAVELDLAAITQAVDQLNTGAGEGAFLVFLSEDSPMTVGNSQLPTDAEDLLNALDESADQGEGYAEMAGTECYYVYARAAMLNAVLVRYFPSSILFASVRHQSVLLVSLAVSFITVMAVSWLMTYYLIYRPTTELAKGFKRVQRGEFDVVIQTNYHNEFAFLCTQFNEMVSNISKLINQVYKQKILVQQAELKQLQSQIDPHFLYNSFFLVNTMAQLEDENLIPFTQHLGEYFQYITRNASFYVPLKEEIRHTQIYAEIQKMRFSKRLTVRFDDCPEAYAQLEIPRLMLQPILENAFKYVAEGQQEHTVISVSYVPCGDSVDIVVEDNGKALTDEKLLELQRKLISNDENLETTGMMNIHRRIQLVYGMENGAGITLARSELGGLKVTLKVGGKHGVQNADRG